MLTIRSKIILATLAVFTVALASVGFIVYNVYRTSLLETLEARIEAYAEKVTAEIEEQHDEENFPNALDFAALHPEDLPHTEMRILDSLGNVEYSDSLIGGIGAPDWRNLLTGGPTYGYEHAGNGSFALLTTPVEVSDTASYTLQILSSLNDVESNLAGLRRLFFLTVPVTLLLVAFLSWYIVGRAFRPITAMIGTAQSISGRNLSRRVAVPPGRDEVHQLAVTLNEMMQRIADAFESQKRFVADASHEIRTPLSIIRSELEFAAAHRDDPDSGPAIETAIEELDHLKRLSDDLLLLASLDASDSALTLSPVRLDELLAGCVGHLRAVAADSGIGLSLHVADAVEIAADEERLRRAILNLVDNAIKFSDRGSAVEVTLGKRGSEAVIVVRDHGIGIPAHELRHIFNRYHRATVTERSRSGNGLGLAIVKRIVDLHHGVIAVESEPGKGSTFSVTLPAS